jgi:hypothetical protein
MGEGALQVTIARISATVERLRERLFQAELPAISEEMRRQMFAATATSPRLNV